MELMEWDYLYARYWSANQDMSEEDLQQRDLVKIKINQFQLIH